MCIELSVNRFLVTGATGFIGRHLLERLWHEGYAIRALVHDHAYDLGLPEKVEIVVGDVRDPQAMRTATAGCHTVFHLAGKVHALSEERGDEEKYRSVNVDGTRNVLEGAAAGGVRCFVLFSSVKAMGEERSRCVDESFDAPPTTAYGRSKLAAEQLVLDYGRRLGLRVVCLRLPLVHGPGHKGNLCRMIAAIDRGFFPPLPDLGNRRSMVHVQDVVQAALLAATVPAADGQCYIVTDPRPYSTREIYELICQSLGKGIPGWHIPVGTLRALGRLGDIIGRASGRRFLLDSEALDKLIGSAWYSSERIRRDLGYCPCISFEDALPEMVAWYRRTQA